MRQLVSCTTPQKIENLFNWGLFSSEGLTDLFPVLVDGQRAGAGVLPPHSLSQPEEKQGEKKKKQHNLLAPHHSAIRRRAEARRRYPPCCRGKR